MNVRIITASSRDINWINEQYDQIHFKRSCLKTDFVAIVEVDGDRVGLGRLQQLSKTQAELGGIYIKKVMRGHGLASTLVKHLLAHSLTYKEVYCLPFEHLERFYRGFGFVTPKALCSIPTEVQNKHRWCNQTYEHKTLLLSIIR